MQLMECPAEDDYITSVAWAADGKHVSVGTSSAQVQVKHLTDITSVAHFLQMMSITGMSPTSAVKPHQLPCIGRLFSVSAWAQDFLVM